MTGTGESQPSAPPQSPRRVSDLPFKPVATAVPVTIAIVSLLFSLYTWWDSTQPPDIHLTLPSTARIVQNAEQPWIYFQPHLIAAGNSDKVVVIDSLALEIEHLPGSEPVRFTWNEEGSWVYDATNSALSWTFVADPHPLVVSAGNPQSPIGLFESGQEWRWGEQEYRGTVVATLDNGDSISEAFSLAVNEQALVIMAEGPGRFVGVHVRPID